ncbi:hypothetical protein JOM56_000269 [Amanita muscaria]
MLRYRSNENVKLIIDDNDTSVTYSANWRADGSYITVFGIIPSILDLKNAGFTTAGSQVTGPQNFLTPLSTPLSILRTTSFSSPALLNQMVITPLSLPTQPGRSCWDYFTIVPGNSGSSPYQHIQKIDDASPNMTYNNAKPLSNTSQADFNGTLHSLSSTQSTASLNFNGNFVAVYGALPTGNSLPVLSFTLDNVDQPVPTGQSNPSGSIPRLSASRKQQLSQILFWKSSTLVNSQHNLLIIAKQGEFLLDFILIQTSDGAGTGPTSSSQSLTPTMTYLASPSSTSASPYGSATSSNSASRSPPSGAPSDHTKTRLTVTTIATAGKRYLVDGSGYILRSSMGSVPPPHRSNSALLSPSPQDLTRLSLPTNSQRMSGNTAACYIDNSYLPVRQSMLNTPIIFTPLASTCESVEYKPRSVSRIWTHAGHTVTTFTAFASTRYEHMLDTQRPSLPPSLPPTYRSSTGHGPHQGYEHTIDPLRSLAPSLPPTYRSSTGHDAHQGYERTQRPSLPPSLPPTYRPSTGHDAHQGYKHTQRASLPLSLPPTYWSSAGHGPHQGYEPHEGIVKD